MDAYAKIPIGDLTLAEAADQVDDPSYWYTTLPPVIYFYRMGLSDYWQLTVTQHRLLVDWLSANKLVNYGDSTQTPG